MLLCYSKKKCESVIIIYQKNHGLLYVRLIHLQIFKHSIFCLQILWPRCCGYNIIYRGIRNELVLENQIDKLYFRKLHLNIKWPRC